MYYASVEPLGRFGWVHARHGGALSRAV